MTRAMLLITTLAFGIDFGWRALPDGSSEYIIQLDEAEIDALRRGYPITSAIPAKVTNVRQIRIQFGDDILPRDELSVINKAPIDPSRDLMGNSGNAVNSGEAETETNANPENTTNATNEASNAEQDGFIPRDRFGDRIDSSGFQGGQGGGQFNASQSTGGAAPLLQGPANGGSTDIRVQSGNPGTTPLSDPNPNSRIPYSGTGNDPNPYWSGSETNQNSQLGGGQYGGGQLEQQYPSQENGWLGNWQLPSPQRDQGARNRAPYDPNESSFSGVVTDDADATNSGSGARPVNNQSNDESTNQVVLRKGTSGAATNSIDDGFENGLDPNASSSRVTPAAQSDAWLWTFFVLCLSLGANIYLAYISRGFYLRYRSVLEQHRRAQTERIFAS